jgi:ATP-dependent Lhr-like helicase
LWGSLCHHVKREASRFIPSTLWWDILWALRRFEARGTVRGGRFVTGFVGEQYAMPEAVELLRRTRRRERTGEIVRLAAVDPLNMIGILTPGPRIPAQRGNVVVYRDGLPLAGEVRQLGPAPLVS